MTVGGIKEKVLAAKRAGINKIMLPQKNKKDLEDVPEHIRKSMKFLFLQEIDEIMDIALKMPEPTVHKNGVDVQKDDLAEVETT